MIKKLLVPVDGSPHSIKAVELAADIASKYEAEVVLLHVLLRGHMPDGLKKALEVEVKSKKSGADNLVVMPQQIMARVGSKKDTQFTIEELNFIGKYILSNVETACKDAGVRKVEKQVEEGDPASVILQVAESSDADMIVMGNRGLSGLLGMLTGSVAQKVANLAKCNCVLVR